VSGANHLKLFNVGSHLHLEHDSPKAYGIWWFAPYRQIKDGSVIFFIKKMRIWICCEINA
jgi:hypothetical protein